MTTFQAPGSHRATTISLSAQILADADTVEVSEGPDRVAMFTWDDNRRTWRWASGQPITGPALHAVIEVSRKAKALTVVAWNDGRRLA